MRREKTLIEKIEFTAQVVFYLSAIAMIIVFFLFRTTEHQYLYLIPAGIAIVARILSYILKYINR